MEKTIYICDCCKKETTANDIYQWVSNVKSCSRGLTFFPCKYDICSKCSNELKEILSNK